MTALGVDLANKTPLRLLAAGYADPHTLKRLGRTRLARFIYRHSRGAWGDAHAEALLAAATQTLSLWDGELDYAELADDIAVEARLALHLTQEIKELDERIGVLLVKLDPTASSPPHPAWPRSPARRSSAGSATPTASIPWPACAPSAAWSHP